MKIKTFFMLIIAFVLLALCSCVSTSSKDKKIVGFKNSRDSLNWPGVYKGIVPLDDGPGLAIRLKLYKDQTFELRFEYIDKSYKAADWSGWFKWDDTGNIIILDIIDAPLYYKVTEYMLIQLDDEGKPISEGLTNYFVLRKEC